MAGCMNSFPITQPPTLPPTLPLMVAYKSMAVGKLFTMDYCPDDPFLLAAGGDKGMLAIWESDEQAVIAEHFASRVVQKEVPIPEPTTVTTPTTTTTNTTTNNKLPLTNTPDSSNNTNNSKVAVTHADVRGGGAVVAEDDSWMDSTGPDTGNSSTSAGTNSGGNKKSKKHKEKKQK